MAAPGPGQGPANEQEKKAAAKSEKEQLQAKLAGLNATIASLQALAATDKDMEQLLQKRAAERDRIKESIKEHEWQLRHGVAMQRTAATRRRSRRRKR